MEPDIFPFNVNSATKKLKWPSSREASFGFCYYKCSTDDNVDYCNGVQQVHGKPYSKHTTTMQNV